MPLANVTTSGSSPKRFEANQSPRATEPGDHLVGNEQHAGLAADRASRLEIAGRRREHAPGPDHRLAEERGDAALRRRSRSQSSSASASFHGNLGDVLDQLAVPGGIRRDAGERCSRRVHAVVGLLTPDQHGAIGFSAELPVPSSHLRGGVDRVRAAAREEDLRPRRRARAMRRARRAPPPASS